MKTDDIVDADAKQIIQHALENDVPVQWLFHRIQQSVIQKTTRLNNDIDFLIDRGDTANIWYINQIEKFEHRKKIFGVEQNGDTVGSKNHKKN